MSSYYVNDANTGDPVQINPDAKLANVGEVVIQYFNPNPKQYIEVTGQVQSVPASVLPELAEKTNPDAMKWHPFIVPFPIGSSAKAKSFGTDGTNFVFLNSTNARAVLNSINGYNWTIAVNSYPIGSNYHIVWNGSYYVGVSVSGSAANNVVKSLDGITWTNSTMPNLTWRGVAWNGSTYCAVASSNVSYATNDYSNWGSPNTMSSFGGETPLDLVACGDTFIAIGSYYYMTSTDGVNWSGSTFPSRIGSPQSGSTSGITAGAGGNTAIVYMANTGGIFITRDKGTTWEFRDVFTKYSIKAPGTGVVVSILCSGSKIYFSMNNGSIYIYDLDTLEESYVRLYNSSKSLLIGSDGTIVGFPFGSSDLLGYTYHSSHEPYITFPYTTSDLAIENRKYMRFSTYDIDLTPYLPNLPI